jgi:AcrR family transcriptional regulator
VEAVFKATRRELATTGYSRLSIEVVAKRAGVNKTTIYRRWPTKASLVVAAISGALVFEAAPAQASLRDDLLLLTGRVNAWVRTPEGTVVTRALAAELHRPEVFAMIRATRLNVREHWIAAVRRAVARGEIPPSTDPHLVFELLTGTMVDAFVRVTQVVDRHFLAAVVDLVIAGLQSGAVAHAAGRR